MLEPSDPNLQRSHSLREPQGHQQRSLSHLHVSYSLRDSDASSSDNNSSSNNNRRKSILPAEAPDVSVANVQPKVIKFQTHKNSQSFRNNPQIQSSSGNTRRTSNPESGLKSEDSNDDDRRDSKIQVFVDNMLRKRKSTLAPEGNEKGSRRQ